jgi:hypothetical protein
MDAPVETRKFSAKVCARRRANRHHHHLHGATVNTTTMNEGSFPDFTVPEKILLAAYELEEQGQSPFSAEQLIVASWQKFPRTFGLKGYADQYPDSNKVLASIMGAKGLASKGWLMKMGQKLYALTREGRNSVLRLMADGDTPARVEPIRITREQEKSLLGLLNSAAVQKFQEGRKGELAFPDASRFWGITENLHGAALDAKLSATTSLLAEIDRIVAKGDAVLTTGQNISTADVNLLTEVHNHMREKFSRLLTLIRTRK